MKFEMHRYGGTRNNPKGTEYLRVESDIHFDKEWIFCGKPYIHLIANKDNPMSFWEKYSIGIGIVDMDDYSIGYIYQPTEEQFFDVLHELINWMHDVEMGLCLYDDYFDKLESGEFFPNLNCKRREW